VNATRLYYGLIVVCVLLTLADLTYHKHGHFSWETLFGFHGFYGFVVFVFIVFAGKLLRRLLMRDEDYYDR